MKLFIVMGVEKERNVDVYGSKVPLKLSWADGMIGVIPVFKSYTKAKEYAEDFIVSIVETEDYEEMI
jgi:hypothetical protein